MVIVTCGGSPAVVGQLPAGAGPLAELDQRIRLALRRAAVIGDTLIGGGAAGGQLLDQRAELAAVLGIQPAFQPKAAVAAIP
jgi:hypothetical protein